MNYCLVVVRWCVCVLMTVYNAPGWPTHSPPRYTPHQNQLMDIRYTDLIASPVKTIESIYRKFGLPGACACLRACYVCLSVCMWPLSTRD